MQMEFHSINTIIQYNLILEFFPAENVHFLN